MKGSLHLPKLACCWHVYWLSGGASLQLGTGTAPGLATGLAAGEGLGPGKVLGLGLGEVPGGQRLQVAAQYPSTGAPFPNMKGSLHLPYDACTDKTTKPSMAASITGMSTCCKRFRIGCNLLDIAPICLVANRRVEQHQGSTQMSAAVHSLTHA